MTSRDQRLMTILFATLAVLLVLFVTYRTVNGLFESRAIKIADLEKKITAAKRKITLAGRASNRMTQYEAKSLPSQGAVARSLYQNWLLEKVVATGLTDQQVSATSKGNQNGQQTMYSFTLSGKGRLPSLVQLMHEFYSVDVLHRISRLEVRPVKNSKLLDIKLTVDAISLKTATEKDKFVTKPAERLKLANLAAYDEIILGRNLFGSTNTPPQLNLAEVAKATREMPFELSVRGEDQDPLDMVTYSIKGENKTTAKIDPATGKFKWTPPKLGSFSFVITATDDGLPALSTEKVVSITVQDPPPPDPPPPPMPKKLAFDEAKFTILSAVIDVAGQGEVWLNIRPRGETLKLHVGDKFEIGSVVGTISAIGIADFTYETQGKLRQVGKGEVLEKAREVAQSSQSE